MASLPGNVFPRNLTAPLPRADHAQGLYIEDHTGKRYMDASGGAVVVNAGHGRQRMAKAVHDQILSHHYIHPTMFTTSPVEKLAGRLAEMAPGELNRFYFFTSGSEANEGAIKLARQLHIERGQESRYRLIGRWKSYHGLTLGALGVMGRTSFKKPFTPLIKENLHIPAPYCYRCAFGLTPSHCDLQCANALDETIENAGPETVSAFIAETLPGATIAAAVPPPEYLPRIAEICHRHGVLLILDEVMCGTGRTGKFYACDHYGVSPDILTLGKGLGGGVIPLSAMATRESHFNTIVENSGAFMHGGTFTHHPVAAAAGNALLDILEEEELVTRSAKMGEYLGECLHKNLKDIPQVGDIRGKGLLWGVELVADRDQKTPFDRKLNTTEILWQKLFDKGYILYKSTGLAGAHGDALVLAPPFTIDRNEIEELVQAFGDVLTNHFN
ncbi:MAG: aminotransferase class III-fold pyridoxal phosphate-dependent enzyme [Desulfobacterales bacterium]|nr:aminotransferase class III-fold pyridoxal phosphate-dependent enzyme [Desulfobacterales bacterium]